MTGIDSMTGCNLFSVRLSQGDYNPNHVGYQTGRRITMVVMTDKKSAA